MRKSTSKINTKKTMKDENADVQIFESENDVIDGTKIVAADEDIVTEKNENATEVQSVVVEDRMNDIKEEIATWGKTFKYQMLDRMRQDCNDYLHGHKATQLWANDEVNQIEYMLAIWDSFNDRDKPQWLSREEILDYAKKMGVHM